ncbi:MAG: hypothetical protein WA741_31455 [Candidatus Sulfotelmatobacter sp.]
MDRTSDSRNDGRDARQPPAPDGRAARTARVVAVHLARLFWPAAVYLGSTALDLIYAARLGLMMRSRAKFPDRAGNLDAQMAHLREQRLTRWSSWKTLTGGRRMEIRFAATVLALAAILGLRAYFQGGESSAGRVAHQPTRAHASSAPSSRGDASTPATISVAEQELVDADHFREYRKQAAPGQWIAFGVEPVESARAHLAEAQVQTKAAEAASTAACHWLYESNAVNASSEKRAACNKAEDRMRAMQSAEVADQNALSRARNPVVHPVLSRGEVDQWDGFKVMSPVVIKDGNRYRMWYVGCHFMGSDYTCGIGHARSSDGVTWAKSPGPVLTIEDSVMSQDLHSISVVRARDAYLMWYAIDSNPLQGNNCSTLNLATSRDGLAWKQQGLVLSTNCQNAAHLWQDAFSDGRTVHLWYADYDASANGSLVHRVSSDGENWQQAGSTDIGILGMDPGRLWVMPGPAGYRALFAAHDVRGYFGMLQSPDGNSWMTADDAPKPVEPGVFPSGILLPEAPVAIVESGGTWMWFAVLNQDDGAEDITMAFQKEAQ